MYSFAVEINGQLDEKEVPRYVEALQEEIEGRAEEVDGVFLPYGRRTEVLEILSQEVEGAERIADLLRAGRKTVDETKYPLSTSTELGWLGVFQDLLKPFEGLTSRAGKDPEELVADIYTSALDDYAPARSDA